LFVVVICLFGGMNIGAVIGWWQDAVERRRLLAKLQLPDTSFTITDGGAWYASACAGGNALCPGWRLDASPIPHDNTDRDIPPACAHRIWRFHLEPPQNDVDSLSGSGVLLAARMGLPFSRLRAAIPDELMSTTLANALGRKRGLSIAALDENLDLQVHLTRRLSSVLGRHNSQERLSRSSSLPRRNSSIIHAGNTTEADKNLEQLIVEREQRETLVGTALVLAFLQVAQLISVVELAQLVSAAKAHFTDVVTPAGWSFEKTQIDFVTLLSPGIMNGRSRWLLRARFWKLMMSQSPEGYWDPTSSVAFSLCARGTQETAGLQRTVKERLRAFIGELFEAFEDENQTNNSDITDTWEHLRCDPEFLNGNDLLMAQFELANNDMPSDDVLASNTAAIVASMPPRLVHLAIKDSSINVTRVWTTLCCMCMLQELPYSFIWGDGAWLGGTRDCSAVIRFQLAQPSARGTGDVYPEQERTIVDGAFAACASSRGMGVILRSLTAVACFMMRFAPNSRVRVGGAVRRRAAGAEGGVGGRQNTQARKGIHAALALCP
jgi:hypothetical protein